LDALKPLVVDTTSSGVTTANNVVDNTSGRLHVTDTQFRELAAYAPGATIRLNAYGLGALATPAVTLTDADGDTRALTIQSTVAQAIDVRLPAAAGLGGAFVTLTSGGAKYFGTLFVDSQDNIPSVNGCTYEPSPSATSVPSSAGSLPILVVTQAGCSYQVLASAPFVNPGAGATGTAVISVGFAANTGAARTATIEIAGQPITVTQSADVPTIAAISNVLTRINTPIAVPITVGSAAGAAGLAVTGSSSNPALVSNANLVFSGTGANRTLTITPAANQKGATTITVTASGANGSVSAVFVLLVGRPAAADVDGDGKSDVTVFRPSTGIWYLRNIVTGLFEFYQWGLNGDVPVSGDYDGDGKADVAVYRPSTGIWYIRNSSNGSSAFLQWGLTGDIPVAGDYDGDGKTDAAVFRPSTGIWYVRDLATNTAAFYQWGLNGDIPVPADYDGDGKTDVAVFRPSTSIWYIRNSTNGSSAFLQWGITGDIPASGDYDGDGKADAAVFRPSTGIWYVRDLVTNTALFYQWGLSGDVPVPGDYDGDGKTDVAVFRPSTSIWYVRPSGNPAAPGFYQWGISGDIPILRGPSIP
jgi:hypothetical protein